MTPLPSPEPLDRMLDAALTPLRWARVRVEDASSSPRRWNALRSKGLYRQHSRTVRATRVGVDAPRECLATGLASLRARRSLFWDAGLYIMHPWAAPTVRPRPSTYNSVASAAAGADDSYATNSTGPVAMERPSNLADLKLVSKHYPVANYSYPRADHAAPRSGRSSLTRPDRSSLGSEGSAPGLIDDRTDSEVSVDDDYQYHAHMAELWDSFWQSAARGKMDEEPLVHPRKQYPALIPSPRDLRVRPPASSQHSPAWPLPGGSPRERNRKPAATYVASSPKPTPTYSAFPRSTMLPPRTPSMTPARASRSGPSPTPSRPPRPSGELLRPCLRQHATVPAILTPDRLPPLSPTMDWRPSSPFVQRASRSLDEGSTRPLPARTEFYHAASRSSTNLPLSSADKPTARAPRHYKSIAHLAPPCSLPPPPPPPPPPPSQPESEPHSVFEYDDSEGEGGHGRSFFRFHKRCDSDNRRISKPATPEPSSVRPFRKRALTAPSSQVRQQPDRLCKQETKRQGHDVFGRMLGRRSR